MPNTVSLEITTREPFAGSESFGAVGAYERIEGRFTLAADPGDPGNPRTVDLDLAARDSEGRVRCTGDFVILRPVELARGNRASTMGLQAGSNRSMQVATQRTNCLTDAP